MKICLVGHFVEHPDEGVRKISYCLANELAKQHNVMTLNISSPTSWKKIRAFRPDIIHFVICPTLFGLITAKLLSLAYPKAKMVISALQPSDLPNGKWMSLFKPDMVLVQSHQSEEMFKALKYKIRFIPNGVEVGKFTPVDAETKQKLRNKYGVPEDKFVILHLASFKKGRNLGVFKNLNTHDNQILLVGRPNESRDGNLIEELKRAGCMVWIDYFSKLEEVYALSDCYVFPTIDKKACIEIPLSVLEAMSCNLPVITTKFGALPRIFKDGNGFFFVENDEEIFKAVEAIKNSNIEIRTREMVFPYSWENIAKRLVEVYEKLLR